MVIQEWRDGKAVRRSQGWKAEHLDFYPDNKMKNQKVSRSEDVVKRTESREQKLWKEDGQNTLDGATGNTGCSSC